ncbi:MAG: glycoside hydrolase family 15 protein [Burkholderiales bacterium]|jgi:GH15 family glucan-1,4-alpha-glucosidase
MKSLDLALIGNCAIGALVDPSATVVWCCYPRFDADPVFCSLLKSKDDFGFLSVDLDRFQDCQQHYLENTPVLVTRMTDALGGVIEVTDFAPRFALFGRTFRPAMLIRRVQRVSGNPRIALRVRPAANYGHPRQDVTHSSNHIRYPAATNTLRLTTDASLTAILQEQYFYLQESVTLIFGADESIAESAEELGRRFLENTVGHWRSWVRSLSIPFEWQSAVIRSAITLKLNAFEDTGAIVAAMTTSIPEAEGSQRNWDYRYCWLRDSYFVVNALNRLGATASMERYIAYTLNVVASVGDGQLQPVYGIDGRAELTEDLVTALDGYRGLGPVRVGNQAHQQVQHDVYGAAILAAAHIFFDQRLERRGDISLFHHLETLGDLAIKNFDQPDAGLWELRGAAHIHTFSAVMCWAACDRLARIAKQLALVEREEFWQSHAQNIHQIICERAWNSQRNTFVSTFDGGSLDASLLLLAELGFIAAKDARFVSTVHAIGRDLRRGDLIFRYVVEDDFGVPENAFIVCTFWYVNALAAIGSVEEARRLFEHLLGLRTSLGFFAEHIDPQTGEQWGNFVQTYSMVGLINSAMTLSIRWDQAF